MWCGFQCTDQLRYVDAGLILFSLKCCGYELSLPMNICSCILCNPCSCLQIVAGIVNYTFLVVIYILEVACILMYLFTWISKFTSILLLYIVMYPDTSRMIFWWWITWREQGKWWTAQHRPVMGATYSTLRQGWMSTRVFWRSPESWKLWTTWHRSSVLQLQVENVPLNET